MTPQQWPASRDFVEAIQNPAIAFIDPELKVTIPAVDRLGMPLVTAGQFAYVFKLNYANGAGAQAVRCFRGDVGDREQRYKAIDDHLNKMSIPALASFEYDPVGISVLGRKYPVLTMEWIDGLPLDVYVAEVFQRPDVLRFLAEIWLKTIGSLRAAGVSHGDLQHGNIIIQNGNVRLVDLDGMFVPAMRGWKASELGHRHYQHPARASHHFSADLDNFSALVIYVSLLGLAECPELWKFHDENLIFTKNDFESPAASQLFVKLKKVASLQKFVSALESACHQGPLQCPHLLDLVAPASKLPAWMRNAPEVHLKTSTREAQAISGAPPAVLAKYQREIIGTPVVSAQPISWQSPTAAPPRAQPVSLGTPPPPHVQQAPTPQLSFKPFAKTLRNALNYAFINIWWAWIWFPPIRALFQGMGAAGDVAGILSISTFLGTCVFMGYKKAVNAPRPASSIPSSPTLPSAPSATVPHAHSLPSSSIASIPTKPITQGVPSHWRIPTYTQPPPSAGPVVQGTTSHFVGNRVSRVFHYPSCDWARKTSLRNRTTFPSSAQAMSMGFRPCRVCNP